MRRETLWSDALSQVGRALIAANCPLDQLTPAAALALERRALLEALPFGDDVDGRFRAALELGCPLLDPALDPPGVDPVAIVRAAKLPPAPDAADPWLIHERLQDLRLDGPEASRDREERRVRGAFFTPRWMCQKLAALVLGDARDSLNHYLRTVTGGGDLGCGLAPALGLLDPACGDGRLLCACLERLLGDLPAHERPDAARRLVATSIRGIDLDPHAAALARTALWRLCDPARGRVAGLERAIQVGDALLGPPGGGPSADLPALAQRYSHVIGNPPFEVLKGFKRRQGLSEYAARLRGSGFRLALSGNLNTAWLFLERGLGLLSPGGRLGFVMPGSFLTGRAASPLRTHLLRTGSLERLVTYPESARAFDGVGQAVALVLVEAGEEPRRAIAIGQGDEPPASLSLEELERLDPEHLPIPQAGQRAVALAARLARDNRSSVGALAEGRVGELDQTFFRDAMRNEPASALLVRGTHLSPFQVDLGVENPKERWADREAFERKRAPGRWLVDCTSPRIAQTGIVNLEATRRLVAALVPPGVLLGNSVNYWVPREQADLTTEEARAYLLGLLNSAPLEWRFRLTSSNNNVNLYEIALLPLPELEANLPSEQARALAREVASEPPAALTGSWPARPPRSERAVALAIGALAERAAAAATPALEAALDEMCAFHLGLDADELAFVQSALPRRAGIARRVRSLRH